ncbi:Ssu72-like protein [Blyttiomyces helicus]|uniref:RNA polymerase II subunit A C-terminal domain phosphatase SSU72 n=1 Tax=Blyttiomyces helicus TaxID=388810 RepID=A0A4P9W3X6_9FUNG|nr:Ssu72-like protein [Blyttiomyces helicus]|eukprot:RKO86015.1 Ssu72-like protein [Blyttiomyces helicus]
MKLPASPERNTLHEKAVDESLAVSQNGRHGFNVCSYGTGTAVRLPGPAADKPNTYQFGTPYDDIYNDLARKDSQLYTANGLLQMLDRNRRIKLCPERFQDNRATFDVIITCEERCFDLACEELANRTMKRNVPVHIINVEIKDNHEEAAVGGKLILQLATMIARSPDRDNEMERILMAFEQQTNANILHSIGFY